MHSMRAVQDGFAKWSASVISRAPVDVQKKLAAGLALVNFRLPVIVMNLTKRPEVALMGFIDESGNVDVEGLRGAGQILARGGWLSFKLPMLGGVDFTEDDIDDLCDCIEGGAL